MDVGCSGQCVEVDIVLTIENIRTLANIIIIDSTCVDLVLRITFSKGMTMMIVV